MLKYGDFTGLYSKENGKKLYYIGLDAVHSFNGIPCILVATDLENINTVCRYRPETVKKAFNSIGGVL